MFFDVIVNYVLNFSFFFDFFVYKNFGKSFNMFHSLPVDSFGFSKDIITLFTNDIYFHFFYIRKKVCNISPLLKY
jgi:hypothetical protein